MKNVLFILALSTLVPHLGHAKECSSDEVQRGCKTTHWEHCYPKTGDCMTIIRCSCSNTSLIPPSASKAVLFSGSFSEGGFTGVRCGPRHPKTGDRTCCNYEDGRRVSCSIQ